MVVSAEAALKVFIIRRLETQNQQLYGVSIPLFGSLYSLHIWQRNCVSFILAGTDNRQ